MSFNAIHLLPGSPLGRLPEARGRGAAVVSGAVYLPPPRRRTNGRPAVPPPRCHSKSPRSRAPQPAKLPPGLPAPRRDGFAGDLSAGEWGGGERQQAGGGAWGFLETLAAAEGLGRPLPTPIVCLNDSAGGWGCKLRDVQCVCLSLHIPEHGRASVGSSGPLLTGFLRSPPPPPRPRPI